MRVLLQARLEGRLRLPVVALPDPLLARQPESLCRRPVEVFRRLERPRQLVVRKGPVVQPRADADAHPIGRHGRVNDLPPHLHRGELQPGREDDAVAVEHLERIVDAFERRQPDFKGLGLRWRRPRRRARTHRARQDDIQHPARVRVDEASGTLHGEPVFRPGISRVRLKSPVLEGRESARLRRLVEQPPGLHLDVLAVGVGQQFLPDHPLARQAPDPRLLPQLVVPRRIPPHPELIVVPIGAKEVRVPADDVVRLVGPEVVLLVEGEVPARAGLDGPGRDFAAVSDVMRARVDELQVAGRLDAGVHPRVVRLFDRRRVVPDRPRGEVGRVGGQRDLEAPRRAGQQVEHADDDPRAEGSRARLVVHRRGAVGRVADDAVIRLDAAAGPRPPHRDVAELHDVVVVDERPPGGLLNGAPDLPADFGKHRDAKVVVLEFDDRPFLVHRRVGVAVEPEVGIDAVDNGNRVGVGEGVRPDHLLVGADRRRTRRGPREGGDQKQQPQRTSGPFRRCHEASQTRSSTITGNAAAGNPGDVNESQVYRLPARSSGSTSARTTATTSCRTRT